MEKAKRGRKPIANPRSIKKCLLFTPAEDNLLKEAAALYGLSQNATVIKAIMELHQRAKHYELTGKYAKHSGKNLGDDETTEQNAP